MASSKRPSIALAERTERGSREARRLRKSGGVPGVLYGGRAGGVNGEALSFTADARELRHLLGRGIALFDVKVGKGEAVPVIVKDQQVHPVRDELMHIDLLEVRLDEKIQTTLAVEITGVEEAPGVKEGGVLDQVSRELNIEALPTDIPENVLVDVSHMEIAATMHLSEVDPPRGVTFLDDPEETIIATVVPPTEVEEPEEVEEETELVGEDGEPIAPEEAEGEEGEAPSTEGEGGESPEGGGEE
jgi:large subunit ribosomal protein L25